MSYTKLLAAAAFISAVAQPAAAVQITVNDYTAQSITFTINGDMPTSATGYPSLYASQLDILFTGNLFSAGANQYASNNASGIAFTGLSSSYGNTGNFGTATNYTWLQFSADLNGLSGTGNAVTVTWDRALLNTSGTGSFDFYWGNLFRTINPADGANMLLDSVSVVNGTIDGGTEVPEPASIALFGASLAAVAFARRRKQYGA